MNDEGDEPDPKFGEDDLNDAIVGSAEGMLLSRPARSSDRSTACLGRRDAQVGERAASS